MLDVADARADEGLRLRSLAHMARSLGRSGLLRDIVELAASEACRAIGADTGSVSVLDPQRDAVKVMVNVGDLGPGEQRWPVDETYRIDEFPKLSGVVQDLHAWSCSQDDPNADPNEVTLLQQLGKASSMGAPIVVDGNLWGELYFTRSLGRPGFDRSDLAYTEALTAILAAGISRALHEEQLVTLAYQDSLTHLPNRRALDLRGSAIAEQCSVVTVVCIDVNGLKQVNDSRGHAQGDRLLQQVAGLLESLTHQLPGSVAARVGGDEFNLVVPAFDDSDEATCAALYRFVRDVLALPHPAGVACGFKTRSDRGQPLDELFADADRAMYEAKAQLLQTPLRSGA